MGVPSKTLRERRLPASLPLQTINTSSASFVFFDSLNYENNPPPKPLHATMPFDTRMDDLTTSERILCALYHKQPISPTMEPLMPRDAPEHPTNDQADKRGFSSSEQHLLCGSKTVAAHDTGGNVMDNFGYIKVNDRWVDPDDVEQVNAAHQNLPDPRLLVEGTGDSSAEDITEGSDEDPEDTDPFFYEGLVRKLDLINSIFAEVSDDEGDPRDNRITPEQFFETATTGPSVEHKPEKLATTSQSLMQTISGDKIENTMRIVRPQDKSKELPKQHSPEAQYDEYTGEELSPLYSVDSHPLPLMTPQGVDMARVPGGYALSYPHHFASFKVGIAEAADLPAIAQQLEDDFLRGAEAVEVPEHGEKFTENGIIKVLNGNELQDNLFGYEGTIALLEKVEKERVRTRMELNRYNSHFQHLLQHNKQLRRDVGKLRADQVVTDAAKARYLQQVKLRYTEIVQDTHYAKQVTQNIRKENHKLAEENLKLFEECQMLQGISKEA